jgi:hypothetical protein
MAFRSAFELLATVRADGNLVASAVAGLLWSAVSLLAALAFLAASRGSGGDESG